MGKRNFIQLLTKHLLTFKKFSVNSLRLGILRTVINTGSLHRFSIIFELSLKYQLLRDYLLFCELKLIFLK